MEKTLGALKKIVFWPTRIIFFVYPVLPFLYGFSWQSVESFSRANFPLPLALKINEVYLRAVQIGAPLFFLSALIQIFFFKRTLWKIIVPLFAFLFCAFFGFILIDFNIEKIRASTQFFGENYFYTEYPHTDLFVQFLTDVKLYKCNLENRDCEVIYDSKEHGSYTNTKLVANEERNELYLFRGGRLSIFQDSQEFGWGVEIWTYNPKGDFFSEWEPPNPPIYLVELSSEPIYWLYQCDQDHTVCSRLPIEYQGRLDIGSVSGEENPENGDIYIIAQEINEEGELGEEILIFVYSKTGEVRCQTEGCTLGEE